MASELQSRCNLLTRISKDKNTWSRSQGSGLNHTNPILFSSKHSKNRGRSKADGIIETIQRYVSSKSAYRTDFGPSPIFTMTICYNLVSFVTIHVGAPTASGTVDRVPLDYIQIPLLLL